MHNVLICSLKDKQKYVWASNMSFRSAMWKCCWGSGFRKVNFKHFTEMSDFRRVSLSICISDFIFENWVYLSHHTSCTPPLKKKNFRPWGRKIREKKILLRSDGNRLIKNSHQMTHFEVFLCFQLKCWLILRFVIKKFIKHLTY